MFDDLDPMDYRDGKAFTEYQAQCEAIIHTLPRIETEQADGRVTTRPGEIVIRALHERLGYRARPEWTLDALDKLKSIEGVGVTITRYRAIDGQVPKFKDRWNADGMRWIFAGPKAQERQAEFASSAR